MLKDILRQFKSGIITQNPTFVLLLGMCPTMAVTTTLQNGVGMGLSVMVVLICSNAMISLLRKVIPGKIRIAAYIVIIAGFVTMVELVLQAYFSELYESLGIFIPLIVVNCILLARAEAFASKNGVFKSSIDGISTGLGFTAALCLMGSIREVIGSGTIWGYPVFGPDYPQVFMMIMPAGGFLTLGLLIAAVQKLFDMKKGGKAG